MTTFSVVPKLQPIKRWTVAIKAKLLDMLLSYKIDVGEVLDFYPDLSAEELLEWREAYVTHGRAGLRSTHLKKYRKLPLKKAA